MKTDFLKRKIYAEKIAQEIADHYVNEKKAVSSSKKKKRENIVFAISGKWGEGKTFLLDQIEPILRKKRFQPIRFNPWQYSQEDISLKRSFLKIVAKELGNKDNILQDLYYDKTNTIIEWKKLINWRKTIWISIMSSVTVLFIVPVVSHVDLLKWNQKISNIFRFVDNPFVAFIFSAGIVAYLLKLVTTEKRSAKVTTAEEFEEKFNALLKGKTKVVIFIDDLDRCTSLTVKVVLDSLRTFFYHPECSYVITGDHTVIERYAAEELNPGKKEYKTKDIEEGRRFLKKLFDVYWRLPIATRREFQEFISQVIIESNIVFNVPQRTILENWLLDDWLFERNPRHVKRFITSLRFALEGVNLQIQQIKKQKNRIEDVEVQEEIKSLEEIINHPDLFGKILLIQEKFYPIYEKLNLSPSEIITHEKQLRENDKSQELLIGNKKIIEILYNDPETYANYQTTISSEPQFTDLNNTTVFDPAVFFASSGATGLPSLKGPDESNFSQYLKTGQLIEKLSSTFDGWPPEKRKRYASKALSIFDETSDQEKLNTISESLKVAGLLDEWSANIKQWYDKIFTLNPEQQNALASEFFKAILKKSPNFLSTVHEQKPDYLVHLWPLIKSIDQSELTKGAQEELINLLKKYLFIQPLNLVGVKYYLDKFDSPEIITDLQNKIRDSAEIVTYLEHLKSIDDSAGKMSGVLMKNLMQNIAQFNSLEWNIENKEYLKTLNLFDYFKKQIIMWARDQKQLLEIVKFKDVLELDQDQLSALNKEIISLINKSADLEFIKDANVQALLPKESRVHIFKELIDIIFEKKESEEKRRIAAGMLKKDFGLWIGLEKNDLNDLLTEINKKKFSKVNDGPTPKEILNSWGFEIKQIVKK
jgi:hypothetical protein